METTAKKLDLPSLRRICDPSALGFTDTRELEPLSETLGQQRAVQAIGLGLDLIQPGFNLYVLGPQGSGRRYTVLRHLESAAAAQPAPADWAYVYDFDHERTPRALRLPAGRGSELARDMEGLVEELETALATTFEGEDYQTRRQALDQELKEREEKAFGELSEQADEQGLMMIRTPLGVAFAPGKRGDVLSPEQFEALPAEEKKRLETAVGELKAALEKVIRQGPRLQRERRNRLQELDREVARFAVGAHLEELRERYRDLPDVVGYLDQVQQDVVRHAHDFVAGDASRGGEAAAGVGSALLSLRRYQVNLLVDHAGATTAPIVEEDHPTFQNLCGRIEHLAQFGTLLTDFTLIKPGALHRANGGYLVLDALSLLRQPFAWDALKRALKSAQLRVEPLAQMLSLASTISLDPAPIPLAVKVVLIGDRALYYLLAAYDPDFLELFKIAADFDDRTEWTAEHQQLYARLVAALVRRSDLAPLDAPAVARVIEQAARDAGDAGRLGLHTAWLEDLLCEVDLWRRRSGRTVASAVDVESAVTAQEHRADRLRERLREETLRGTLCIDTTGSAVGQVNGLSVLELGGFRFGHPVRISARARLGGGEVVDIEREVELSGPIHSKGVLILSGFLGERYSAEWPLSVAASLVFEQSYGGVEGDSASLAELCALLSAIGNLPLRQSVALTGAVDQHGRVLAVGGVNEKVEGFFDLCAARGLDGGQGVLVPAANVQHLMLRSDVVDAVAAGRFHLWSADHVDQALELLAGMPAGVRGEDGIYPQGSCNAAVEMRLAAFAEVRRQFGAPGREETPEEGS